MRGDGKRFSHISVLWSGGRNSPRRSSKRTQRLLFPGRGVEGHLGSGTHFSNPGHSLVRHLLLLLQRPLLGSAPSASGGVCRWAWQPLAWKASGRTSFIALHIHRVPAAARDHTEAPAATPLGGPCLGSHPGHPLSVPLQFFHIGRTRPACPFPQWKPPLFLSIGKHLKRFLALSWHLPPDFRADVDAPIFKAFLLALSGVVGGREQSDTGRSRWSRELRA